MPYLDSPNDNDFQAPDVVYREFAVIYAPSLSHRGHYRWAMITTPRTTIDVRQAMYINYVVTSHHIFSFFWMIAAIIDFSVIAMVLMMVRKKRI
jgi:hypothetical protein